MNDKKHNIANIVFKVKSKNIILKIDIQIYIK